MQRLRSADALPLSTLTLSSLPRNLALAEELKPISIFAIDLLLFPLLYDESKRLPMSILLSRDHLFYSYLNFII